MYNPDNYHILIIDDMPSIHQDFKKVLSPEGTENFGVLTEMTRLLSKEEIQKTALPLFDFEFALQGDEGVSLVEKSLLNHNPFALAFVDIQMPPGDDGVVTISKIWAIDPEIQIVICTAFSKYSWKDLRKRFGDTDKLYILKKPFDSIEAIQLACALCKKWNVNRGQSTKTGSKIPLSSVARSNETLERLNEAMNMLSKLKTPPKT